MSAIFEYRADARSWLNCAALALAALVAAGAWLADVRVLSGIIFLAFLAPTALRLCVNPRRGFTLTADRIEIFAPGGHRIIPFQRVDSVIVGSVCDLRLTTGESVIVPQGHRVCPTVLSREFRSRGVDVVA